MKSQLLYCTATLCLIFSSSFAQEKLTLYYDQNGKGLDTKKNAVFYRVVSFDGNNKPVGTVQDFYLNHKPRASGEAGVIDKFDNNKSHWKGPVTTYDERGKIAARLNYDEDGSLDGTQTRLNADGEKIQEQEYVHGNPAKDYYLVYDKKGNTSRYSYLSHLPVKLATSDKNIVPFTNRQVIYQDGQPVQFYFINGISVAVKLSTKQLYGDYYEAYITIENGSNPQFNFDPTDITATFEREGAVEEGTVLSYNDYMKKVKRRQAWTAAFTAFAETAAATSAGYSSTKTTINTQSSSGRSVSVQAKSATYDGAAVFNAAQQAGNNMNQMLGQQYDIKQTISEGYLKINTIFPNSRVVGFVNIKHVDADRIYLNVPVNGKVYHFEL